MGKWELRHLKWLVLGPSAHEGGAGILNLSLLAPASIALFWAATPGGKSHPQIENTEIHRIGGGEEAAKETRESQWRALYEGSGFFFTSPP